MDDILGGEGVWLEGGDGSVDTGAGVFILALAAGEAEDSQVGERSAEDAGAFIVEPDGVGVGVFIAPRERDSPIKGSVFGDFSDLRDFTHRRGNRAGDDWWIGVRKSYGGGIIHGHGAGDWV